MTDERDPIRKVLAYLVACYPTFEPDAATTAAWAVALEGYTPEELKRAAVQVSRTHTHGPPSASHVAQAAREYRQEQNRLLREQRSERRLLASRNVAPWNGESILNELERKMRLP